MYNGFIFIELPCQIELTDALGFLQFEEIPVLVHRRDRNFLTRFKANMLGMNYIYCIMLISNFQKQLRDNGVLFIFHC